MYLTVPKHGHRLSEIAQQFCLFSFLFEIKTKNNMIKTKYFDDGYIERNNDGWFVYLSYTFTFIILVCIPDPSNFSLEFGLV